MGYSDLEGKTALVTGAAQGIGKGIALRLLREGMNVVLGDVDREAGEETLCELEDLGQVRFVPLDVSDEDSVSKTVAWTISTFGRLDALVNNAGIARSMSGPVEDLPLQEWNRILGTNLTGAFLCVKHALPSLREREGAVVNISSTRALQSEPDTEAYSASKGGLIALTHALAVSLGPRVRVNCVSPGWIEVSGWKRSDLRREPSHSDRDRNQHPAGRVGTPHDVAALTACLLSTESSFITGQNFIVDGGMTRRMIYAE
ncbi:MAG: SDR family oxidoreductase [Proteobacteria bacterium]|nr:SDR family oxidoreductase [Pseudomonadota bacterium]